MTIWRLAQAYGITPAAAWGTLGGRPLGRIEEGILTLAATDCGSIDALYSRRVSASRTKGGDPKFSPEERGLLEAIYGVWLATKYDTVDVFECDWPDGA